MPRTLHDDVDAITRILLAKSSHSVKTCSVAATQLTRALYVLAHEAPNSDNIQFPPDPHKLAEAVELVMDVLDNTDNPCAGEVIVQN